MALKFIAFNLANAHVLGNALRDVFAFRYKNFILGEKYNVRSYSGLEFDQYDNPFTIYHIMYDGNTPVATLRLNRTDCQSMISDFWPTDKMPTQNNVYEITRTCLEKENVDFRRNLELFTLATHKYFMLHNSETHLYLATAKVVNLYKKLQYNPECIDAFVDVSGEKVYTVLQKVPQDAEKRYQDALSRSGLHHDDFFVDVTECNFKSKHC